MSMQNKDREDILNDTCDLDPSKICDNCEKCLGLDKDYRAIRITEIITDKKTDEK